MPSPPKMFFCWAIKGPSGDAFSKGVIRLGVVFIACSSMDMELL